MQIKSWEGIAAGNQLFAMHDAFEEWHECRIAFHDELGVAVAQERQQADELNCISEPGFGVDEDGFPRRIGSIPLGLAEATVDVPVRQL